MDHGESCGRDSPAERVNNAAEILWHQEAATRRQCNPLEHLIIQAGIRHLEIGATNEHGGLCRTEGADAAASLGDKTVNAGYFDANASDKRAVFARVALRAKRPRLSSRIRHAQVNHRVGLRFEGGAAHVGTHHDGVPGRGTDRRFDRDRILRRQ